MSNLPAPTPPRRTWRRRAGAALLLLASTRPGAWLATAACRYVAWLLPVRRVYRSPATVAFGHPVPEARDHIVLVARQRVPDLPALLACRDVALLIALIDAARTIAEKRNGDERALVINLGGRQQVPQLHAHLLTLRAMRRSIEEIIALRRVDLDDAAALESTLTELVACVHAQGGAAGGAILVLGLFDAQPLFAATVTQ